MRLFVALELPPPVVATLEEWGRGAAREGLRLLPAESLHVTLAFLGERPDEEVEPIAAAVQGAAAPVGALSLAAPVWLPPRRPGVLAVDLGDGDGSCARLQRDVAASLAALGAYTPEKRPFRPHVTVGRVRRGARVDREVPGLPDAATFSAPAATVYLSRLGPKGARYAALRRIPLP